MKLSPCPHCGGEPYIHRAVGSFVHCDCRWKLGRSDEEAIAAWNARLPEAPVAEVPSVEEIRKAYTAGYTQPDEYQGARRVHALLTRAAKTGGSHE